MKTFEYKVVELRCVSLDKEIEQKLLELGSEGWELVQVSDIEKGLRCTVYLYLKREIVE